MSSQFFQKYLLPGFIFQSVVIAGGYGTGRELVEFFLQLGPTTGLLAMAISTAIWSAVCAASYELSRMSRSYDYRSFSKQLLGRGWFVFEILYLAQILLVLAIIAAAAGAILNETFRLPTAVGVVGMTGAVGFLAIRGTPTIEKFLAGWSFVLYGVYVFFFVWCMARFGRSSALSFVASGVDEGWLIGGVTYAAYNLSLIPALLFSMRHVDTRREAVTAGVLTGPIAMMPGLLLYIAMAGQYPAIVEQTVPVNFMLQLLGSRVFQTTFQVMLFGTLIESGVGMVHGVNERVARVYEERRHTMPAALRSLIAVGLLVTGAVLARFGIIDLIASGYGTITWFFLAVYVVPVLTFGVWKILKSGDWGLGTGN